MKPDGNLNQQKDMRKIRIDRYIGKYTRDFSQFKFL